MVWRFRPHPRNRASCYVNATPDDNPGLSPGIWVSAYTSYERRDEELGLVANTPRVLRTEGVKAPSDFFGPGGVGVVVSLRFKDLVQSFEPERHDFRSVVLKDEKNRDWPGSFFLWRVKNYVQAIDIESSSVARHRKYGDAGEFFSLEAPQKLVIDMDKVGGRDIWRNEPNIGHDLYCSDRFHKACKNSGLKYLLFNKCIEASDELR